MLLSIFAIAIGVLVGRIRGGTWSGITAARLYRPGFLVFGVFTMLVISLIGPAFPLLWAIAGTLSMFWFGLRNLQLTGMIVMLIGLLMNLTPLLANGAVPTSELALVSVGQVDDSGQATIEGLRESTETATAFSAFGDVIPVPLFNAVVSIGDLVMLVALADITTNLLLRRRKNEPKQEEAVEPASAIEVPDAPAIMSPLSRNVKSRPAHAAHRRPRRNAAPSTHIPAHAKNPDDVFGLPPASEEEVLAIQEDDNDDLVIVLDGANAFIDSAEATPEPLEDGDLDLRQQTTDADEVDITQAPQPWADDDDFGDLSEALRELEALSELPAATVLPAATLPPTEIVVPGEASDIDATAEFNVAAHVAASTDDEDDPYDGGEDTARLERIESVEQPEQIDLTSVATTTPEPKPIESVEDAPDRRPIIDLTVSPTDEQLQEFLRRRAEADAEYERRSRAPGPKPRGRAPRRGAKVGDLTS